MADLCFLVQHYELAYSCYHTAKKDFLSDQAMLYAAGALVGLGSLLGRGEEEEEESWREELPDAVLVSLQHRRGHMVSSPFSPLLPPLFLSLLPPSYPLPPPLPSSLLLSSSSSTSSSLLLCLPLSFPSPLLPSLFILSSRKWRR